MTGEAPKAERRSSRLLLERYGLRPKKSWGQNFLEDGAVLDRIAAAAKLSSEDVVVEIGPGLGALTVPLAARAAKVVAVERDPDMVRVLQTELAGDPRVEIEAGDAMEVDVRGLARRFGRPVVVVGNLPYQITSPLLFKLLAAADGGDTVARGVFMVQREVAERLVATPGSKIYGRLSVMAQQLADIRILFHVGSHAFVPRPNVTSTVFSWLPRRTPLAPVRDARLFAAVVRAAFQGRRKMLRRSLEPVFGESAAAALADAGVEGTRRAEELDVAAFGRIAEALFAGGVRAGEGPPEGEGEAGEEPGAVNAQEPPEADDA